MAEVTTDESRRPAAQPIEEIEFDPARSAADGSRRRRLILSSIGLVVVGLLAVSLWFFSMARIPM